MLPIDEMYVTEYPQPKKYDWIVFKHKSGDFLYMTKEKYANIQIESYWKDLKRDLQIDYEKYMIVKDETEKGMKQLYENVLLPMET